MTKTEEIHFFKRFIGCLEPYWAFNFESRDRPDIELITSDKVIGVEITEILDKKRRARQMLIKEIGEKVVTFLGRHFERRFHLGLTFEPSLKARKSDIPVYASTVASQIMEFTGKKPSEEIYSLDLDSFNTNGFMAFTLIFSEALSKSYFSESATGIVPNFTHNDFKTILRKKEAALKGYTPFDEQWLLIAEGNFLAGSINKIEIDQGKVNSNFDRIYLFRQQTQEIIKIKT